MSEHQISVKPVEKFSKKLNNPYKNLCNLFIDSMFSYVIDESDLITFWISEFEKTLRTKGRVAVFCKPKNFNSETKKWEFESNRLICSEVDFVGGQLNEYGVLEDCICTLKNGKQLTFNNWIESDDVVIVFNNLEKTADTLQKLTASIQFEADVSIKADVIGTRYNKVIMADNDNEKSQIVSAIKANESGVPQVVVGNLSLPDMFKDVQQERKMYDLTDINSSDKIQYISKLKDENLRQFLNLYGLTGMSQSKMAQQSVDEILAYLPMSFVIPLSRLEARQRGLERINKVFGKSWGVKFSRSWEITFEMLMERVKANDSNDSLVDQTVNDAHNMKDASNADNGNQRGGDNNVDS